MIVGPRRVQTTRALKSALPQDYLPFGIEVPVTPGAPQAHSRSGCRSLAAMTAGTGAAAYVCRDFACRQPVSDPEDLAQDLRHGARVASGMNGPVTISFNADHARAAFRFSHPTGNIITADTVSALAAASKRRRQSSPEVDRTRRAGAGLQLWRERSRARARSNRERSTRDASVDRGSAASASRDRRGRARPMSGRWLRAGSGVRSDFRGRKCDVRLSGDCAGRVPAGRRRPVASRGGRAVAVRTIVTGESRTASGVAGRW